MTAGCSVHPESATRPNAEIVVVLHGYADQAGYGFCAAFLTRQNFAQLPAFAPWQPEFLACQWAFLV